MGFYWWLPIPLVKCPDSDEGVCVGTAGPAGIVQHQGKKPCRKAWQVKEAKRKIRTLFQVGVTKVKVSLPVIALTSSDDSPRQVQQAKTECKGCKLWWKLIAELKAAVERMTRELWARIQLFLVGSTSVKRYGNVMGKLLDFIWSILTPISDYSFT